MVPGPDVQQRLELQESRLSAPLTTHRSPSSVKTNDSGVSSESFEQMGGCQSRLRPMPFVQRDFPRGTIKFWSGAIADIPLTWRLCDGTRKTPDLRDRFLVGAGNTYAPSDTGGFVEHLHDFTGDTHRHSLTLGPHIDLGAGKLDTTTYNAAIGTTDNRDGLPPYHSLVLIMYDGRLR
ncbi:hypothetical protein ES703_113121 [subsurface metagenome]